MIYMIIVWVCSAFLCGYIASQKNRGGIGWFLAGLAFGIFAVIAIAAVPSLSEEERKQRERDAMGEEDPELEEWKRKMGRSVSVEGQMAAQAKKKKQTGQNFFYSTRQAMQERSAREEGDERET